MNKAFKKTAAFLMSVAMVLSSVPSSFAATVDSGSGTTYSVQKNASAVSLASNSGGTYAAVLRSDKVGNAAQTETTGGYSQQVETKLSDAAGSVSATYFEQDKYLSEPTGEKNGQSTYNITIENAYVGSQILTPAPEGQDIIIIEDASASMGGRVRFENDGVKQFLQQMQKINNKRIQNAQNGVYADYNPDGKTAADAEKWLKDNGKLLRLIGVESFNHATYTKWRQGSGSYVLSDSEVTEIANASYLRDGYPDGPDLKDLTGTDKALQNVRSWMSNPSNTTVVLLTDGEPYGDWSNDDLSCGNTDLIMFNSTTANNAISIAKEMKSQGVTIYASYMFYESNWDNENFRMAFSAGDISLITMPPYHNISAVTLSLISSDYPGGGKLGTVSGGTGLNWTFTVDKTNANGFGTYMRLMQNEGQIAESIASIAGEIDTISTAKSEKDVTYAGSSSYILDDISHPFALDGDISSIRVYQVPRVPTSLDSTGHPADASNVTSFTWGEKEDITDMVSVTLDGNRIKVTGYNYEYNALTNYDHDLLLPADLRPADPSLYEAGDYGYKIVVEFPIYANQSFGGNDIETNDSTTSGFYPSTPGSDAIQKNPEWTSNTSKNPSKNKYVALYPVPIVDLIVNYAIVADNATIYAPQTEKLVDLVSAPDSPYIFNVGETQAEVKEFWTLYNNKMLAEENVAICQENYVMAQDYVREHPDNEKAQSELEDSLAALNAATAKKTEATLAYNTLNTYLPDGENNAYVDIVYTLTSPSGKVVGTMNVPHGVSVGDTPEGTDAVKWVFTDGDDATIQESGTYRVSATITPVKTTREESYTGSSAADETCAAKTYNKEAESKIFVLQITMTDTAKRPGQVLDYSENVAEDIFASSDSSDWTDAHWISAKWVCTDGSTASNANDEPGNATAAVGEKPTGLTTAGETKNIASSNGTYIVSKDAEDGVYIPVRIDVHRTIGDLNKSATTEEQTRLKDAAMSDDDHLYGAFSSIVWKHECDTVDDCDNNELKKARAKIDGGKSTGQNITRFLIHISDTILPEVGKTTSTPTIDVGGDIQWKVTVSNDNEKENKNYKSTKAQMLDVLPYQNDGRENPNTNEDGGSSFGSELYFKTISVDCGSASSMVSAYQDGSAKFYYTTDAAVRTATREQWYDGGSIQWTEVTPSVNGNTVSFSVPQNAVAIKSDTSLAWGEKIVFNLTANVKDTSQQKTHDVYINQALIGNDDQTVASDPVVTELVPVAITGYVWYDDNANGQMDVTEEKTKGVTVSLYRDLTNASTEHITVGGVNLEKVYNAKDELVTSYVTGSNGYFEFNNLLAGKYYVVATGVEADYKVTKKQASGTDSVLNSKAEETMPAGQTAWIKEIWVGSSSVTGQNIGLVVQKGAVTLKKVMEDGTLSFASSMTEEDKQLASKSFVFKLVNNATGKEYSSSIVMDLNHTDGVTATFEDLPLGTYTLSEVNALGYEVADMTAEWGSFSYNATTKNATVNIVAGNTEVSVIVTNKAKTVTPGVNPGEGVVNSVGTATPTKFKVEYSHGDINDTSVVSYTFKQSDFKNMTIWYDNGTYRDFTGTYRENADGSIEKIGTDTLRFDEVTLTPATVTNEMNTGDTGNKITVNAYITDKGKTFSDKFTVGVNLKPIHKFVVVFHANGSTFSGGTDTNTVKFKYNDITGKNDIVSGVYQDPAGHTGWTYAGWNTASDGSGTNYDSLTALNDIGANQRNVTQIDLYAHYTTTVTFNANGGTNYRNGNPVSSVYSITVNVHSRASSNGMTAARAAYNFLGWNTAANGAGTSLDNYGEILGPVTFYAILYKTEFGPTKQEEIFVTPKSGRWKLEVWGAYGNEDSNSRVAVRGGYGGYVSGEITLQAGDVLYVNVGTTGTMYGGKDKYLATDGTVYSTTKDTSYSYNGGGNSGGVLSVGSDGQSAGGGATSICKASGLLNDVMNSMVDAYRQTGSWSQAEQTILVVAGGGGAGKDVQNGNGGDANTNGYLKNQYNVVQGIGVASKGNEIVGGGGGIIGAKSYGGGGYNYHSPLMSNVIDNLAISGYRTPHYGEAGYSGTRESYSAEHGFPGFVCQFGYARITYLGN